MNETLTAVTGLRVGHWTHEDGATGCTVVLCPEGGCIASGEVRGGAPGTRETALLEPEKSVQRIHAVTLSGGSAFGLAAADGVTQWLDEKGVGYETPFAKVPLVPAAVIYDLGVGQASVRPTAEAGYKAAEGADDAPIPLGRVGVGVGATCGKYLGFDRSEYSGLGSASVRVRGATVAALSVSNPVGDIVDPDTGEVVVGARLEGGSRPNPTDRLTSFTDALLGTNTTLVVVATDAPISKAEAKALAQSAHIGVSRVTRPSHTVSDGDTTFALSTGTGPTLPMMLLSVAVQEVVAASILAGANAANASRSSSR